MHRLRFMLLPSRRSGAPREHEYDVLFTMFATITFNFHSYVRISPLGPADVYTNAQATAFGSRSFASSKNDIPEYEGPHEDDYWIQFAHKRGTDVLNDPIFNRCTQNPALQS